MRPARRKFVLLAGFALLVLTAALAGCENPFSPLDKSSKIEGLSYVDVTATWDRWDSDPEYDGEVIDVLYYSMLGDTLTFHDKSHDVTVEFWSPTEKPKAPTDPEQTFDRMIFSKTFKHSNSDDQIRIPIETYYGFIPGIDDTTTSYDAYVVLRVHPPDDSPRPVLVAISPLVSIWEKPAPTPE